MGDPRLLLAIHLAGAPPLGPVEFRNYKEGTIVDLVLQAPAPLGQCDEPQLINLGSNRWSFRTELGASRRLDRWFVEAYAGAWSFTANSEFLGTNTLTQEPLFVAKLHGIRALSRKGSRSRSTWGTARAGGPRRTESPRTRTSPVSVSGAPPRCPSRHGGRSS